MISEWGVTPLLDHTWASKPYMGFWKKEKRKKEKYVVLLLIFSKPCIKVIPPPTTATTTGITSRPAGLRPQEKIKWADNQGIGKKRPPKNIFLKNWGRRRRRLSSGRARTWGRRGEKETRAPEAQTQQKKSERAVISYGDSKTYKISNSSSNSSSSSNKRAGSIWVCHSLVIPPPGLLCSNPHPCPEKKTFDVSLKTNQKWLKMAL